MAPRIEHGKESFQVCVPIHGAIEHGDGAMDTGKSPMRELVISVGGNLRPSENRTAWLYRVATTAGLNYRLVRGAWHGEAISFETARKLKLAAEKKQNEARNTAARLESIAARLEKIDADFHRSQMDLLRDLAARYRNLADGNE